MLDIDAAISAFRSNFFTLLILFGFLFFLKKQGFFKDAKKPGELVETMVFNHCFAAAKEKSGRVFYWRDKQKREVDVILEIGNETIPVEVKYRAKIMKKDEIEKVKYSVKNFMKDY